jgi:hypothetical protein
MGRQADATGSGLCSAFVLARLASMARRRYPGPWKVIENGESYLVTDATGNKLAYVYFEDEPQRRMAMGRIGQADAYQLANLIARIPGFIRRD